MTSTAPYTIYTLVGAEDRLGSGHYLMSDDGTEGSFGAQHLTMGSIANRQEVFEVFEVFAGL